MVLGAPGDERVPAVLDRAGGHAGRALAVAALAAPLVGVTAQAALVPEPVENDRGAVVGQPGLYVLGQLFEHRFSSHNSFGVRPDAQMVVDDIVRRTAQVTVGRS